MRTLTTLAFCMTLPVLAGCMVDEVEATEPSQTTGVSQPAASGQEIYRMFSDQKAHAVEADLPTQF